MRCSHAPDNRLPLYVHAKDGSRSHCRIPSRLLEVQEEMSAVGVAPVIVGSDRIGMCHKRPIAST